MEPQEVKNPKFVCIVGCLGLLSNLIGLVLFHDHSHGHGHSHGHADIEEGDFAEEGHGHEHSHDPVPVLEQGNTTSVSRPVPSFQDTC